MQVMTEKSPPEIYFSTGIIICTPGRARTPNLLVRSQTLCPVELRALMNVLAKPNSPPKLRTGDCPRQAGWWERTGGSLIPAIQAGPECFGKLSTGSAKDGGDEIRRENGPKRVALVTAGNYSPERRSSPER